MHNGAEIFGGTVVMGSTYSTPKPEIAISAQAVPVKIHAGGTLEVEAGGSILANAANIIQCSGDMTFTGAQPFTFAGTISCSGKASFDLTGAAVANEPDFTVFLCGDTDVAAGVADATILANYKEAVTRIKAALPMTTVIACMIPGGSVALNGDIASWCASEADVECVDVSALITLSQTETCCSTLIFSIAFAGGS